MNKKKLRSMRFFHHNYEFTIQWSVAFSGYRTTYSKNIGLFICLFVCKLDHFIERLFFFVQLFRVNTVIIIAIIECFFIFIYCVEWQLVSLKTNNLHKQDDHWFLLLLLLLLSLNFSTGTYIARKLMLNCANHPTIEWFRVFPIHRIITR